MSGCKDHSVALKNQTMKDEDRIARFEKKRRKDETSKWVNPGKLFDQDGCSFMDNLGMMQHGNELIRKIGRPLSYNDMDIFTEEIEKFFTYCNDKHITPTQSGLSIWLGVDMDTYRKWANDSAFPMSQILKRVETFFHQFVQQKTIEGKINPVLYMFLAKNMWGYSDKTEIVHKSQSTQVIDITDQQRILNDTPGIIIEADFKPVDEQTKQLGINTYTDLEQVLKGSEQVHRTSPEQVSDFTEQVQNKSRTSPEQVSAAAYDYEDDL